MSRLSARQLRARRSGTSLVGIASPIVQTSLLDLQGVLRRRGLLFLRFLQDIGRELLGRHKGEIEPQMLHRGWFFVSDVREYFQKCAFSWRVTRHDLPTSGRGSGVAPRDRVEGRCAARAVEDLPIGVDA